ncbi:hypothetical protein EJ03DRAFT_326234 [Teratosphaeria nubilosa]|uniref:Uncharacterized protein n=1 Tax=Teratosphaeria nubilosa TaxID=161662 RepID=A0A6G1LDF4_9PEZI|nr:hypothetical protein EJ03DRAFT_326234 [Teratosphaeria nubilosa]
MAANSSGLQVLPAGVGYGIVIGIGGVFALLMLCVTESSLRGTKCGGSFFTSHRDHSCWQRRCCAYADPAVHGRDIEHISGTDCSLEPANL